MRARTFVLGVVLVGITAAPAAGGPPWISIEYPANPFSRVAKDALFVVHTYHHDAMREFPVFAVADGHVDGVRRQIHLEVVATGRTGVWAVHGKLPAGDSWVVSATMTGSDERVLATALVAVSAHGEVVAVRVPFRTERGWVIPREPNASEVDALLRVAQTVSSLGPVATVGAPSRGASRFHLLAGFGVLALLPLGLAVVRRRTL